MIRAIHRRVVIYQALAAMVVKRMLAYPMYFWANTVNDIASITIVVFFWRAVYAGSATIGGLSATQTINYILIAQLFAGATQGTYVFHFGGLLRAGGMASELLRPLDFQERMYAERMGNLALFMVSSALPKGLFAWYVFDLRLPADPVVWFYFVAALLLGQAVLFCFDWVFSSLAFYTTETWGLRVLSEAVTSLFSGLLIPLVMLPGWLQKIAAALPFAQGLYVPVALLTGVTPVSEGPRILLGQVVWLVGLALFSRLVFGHALRKVTVQGG